jgi:hypothetical protein
VKKAMKKTVNVGIGFATGRKNFRQVARTYAENWHECGLTDNGEISLNLFVAYDLKYKNTKPSDYKDLDKRIIDMLDYPYFIGDDVMKKEAATLVSNGVINTYEAELLFGEGYAKKRNAVLYFAIKKEMDYLLFIDDDEYPMAALRSNEGIHWRGQEVLSTHLLSIKNADITHGHHCGYVSPIPHIRFNDLLTENDFQLFIETISNDIISWESIREKIADGGVTYADERLIDGGEPYEVREIDHAKFISGSNLFIKINTDSPIYPFYNPPGARGEDTFLSTCLTDLKVLKVPCYTFHDGFSMYPHLLNGILPYKLKPVSAGNSKVDDRFFKACVGWIRYKPLLLYITRRDTYASEIAQMKENLQKVLPKVCAYFKSNGFLKLFAELDYYAEHVKEHYEMFEQTKACWMKVVEHVKNHAGECAEAVKAK